MRSAGALTKGLREVAAEAAELERQGANIASALEGRHDPLLQLAIAATGTNQIGLMTSIIVAFARSPMTLALQAHEINALSGGRLMLGIGSQIKPHIEKRFSMPWSKPAARMREYVLALKAICLLVRGRTAGFSRRILYPHPDDPHVHPHRQEQRRAARVGRGSRPADGGKRGGGGRRITAASVHD